MNQVITGNAAHFRVNGGAEYVGQWTGECYRVVVEYDVMVAMRGVFDIVHEQAVQPGGSVYAVEYNTINIPVKSVTIPACEQHEGIYVRTVHLRWLCPVCGMLRGEPFETISYDGSRRLHVHGWKNGCGHVDKYADVRAESDRV
jgi:hypothetical protein